MPHDNVEIARRAWEAFAAGNLPALFAMFHPGAEWHTATNEGLAGGLEVHRGEAEIRRFFDEWTGSFDRYEVGADEFLQVGSRVVVLCWQRAHLRGSQVPIELEWAQILSFRDGRIVRVDNYSERGRALAAAGLEPGGTSGRELPGRASDARSPADAAGRDRPVERGRARSHLPKRGP